MVYAVGCAGLTSLGIGSRQTVDTHIKTTPDLGLSTKVNLDSEDSQGGGGLPDRLPPARLPPPQAMVTVTDSEGGHHPTIQRINTQMITAAELDRRLTSLRAQWKHCNATNGKCSPDRCKRCRRGLIWRKRRGDDGSSQTTGSA